MAEEAVLPPPAVFLGQLIVAQRRELGQSQRDLADRFCVVSGRPTVTRHEISRYEREVRVPGAATVAPLAAALDLPESWVRQAAQLSRLRRRLREVDPDSDLDQTLDVYPGYLFAPGESSRFQPMLLIGEIE
jgi:transcriptional regulator with XRE-family HTH domain